MADIFTIIERIRTTWQSGHRIVPIVGAGLSVDSGVPIVSSLMRYLAKFDRYLEHSVYLPFRGAEDTVRPLESYESTFRRDPSEFVQSFGWPDRFDLNQHLLASLERRSREGPKGDGRDDEFGLDSQINAAYSAILKKVAKEKFDRYDRLIDSIVDRLPAEKSKPSSLRETIRRSFATTETGKHWPFELLGDWRRVLQHFTNHKGDYADALFHKLGGARQPSVGHRHLAFLAKLLAVRTIFTFNFDDLIERALRQEGVEHQTFAMEYGADLPHRSLLQDVFAVVKMHGGTHSLLLDERLDYPLKADYKKRFREIVGRKPLYLVLGCSGERRLVDLLETALRDDPDARMAWFHFETDDPQHVKPEAIRNKSESEDQARDRILACRTHNIGLTLQHLQTALSGRHPVSSRPYHTHTSRPHRAGHLAYHGLAEEYAKNLDGKAALVVETLGSTDDQTHYLSRTASELLLDISALYSRRGYSTIWVNLELYHTFAAVVGSIVDQCRAIDSNLAPVVLNLIQPNDEDSFDRGLERVLEALERSRYLVIFDGLEAFPWPPMSHHGEAEAKKKNAPNELEQLTGFLKKLAEHDRFRASGSRLAVGIDRPTGRRKSASGTQKKLNALIAELQPGGGESKHWTVGSVEPDTAAGGPNKSVQLYPFSGVFEVPGHPANGATESPFVILREHEKLLEALAARFAARLKNPPKIKNPRGAWGLAFFLHSTVRRARDLVLSRHMLRPIFGTPRGVDAALRALTDEPDANESLDMPGLLGISRLENGGIWYLRPVRNYVYGENSKYAAKKKYCEAIKVGDRAGVGRSAQQLMGLFFVHQWAARGCYGRMFVQSQDAVSFLEYVYHRISALRYLFKLIHMAHGCRHRGKEVTDGFRAGLGALIVAFKGSLSEEFEHTFFGFHAQQNEDDTDGAARSEPNRKYATLKAWLCDPVGGAVSPDALVGEWESVFVDELGDLTKSWIRSESVLRTQLPAEQVLFWCTKILEDDLEKRFKIGGGGREEGIADIFSPSSKFAAMAAIKGLQEAIADLTVKLRFERSDFGRAVATRLNFILQDLGIPRDGDEIKVDRFLQKIRAQAAVPKLVHVHHLLDGVICCLRREQDEHSRDEKNPPAGIRDSKKLLELADSWYRALLSNGLPPGTDLREARLRILFLEAETEMSEMSVFGRRVGFRGKPLGKLNPEDVKQNKDRIDRAARFVAEGQREVRSTASRSDGRLRSLTLEPSSNGSMHVPYRAAFRALNARLHWLRAIWNRDDRNSPERLESAFESAFRDFDLASAGLSGANFQIAAINELYRVEAALARARLAIHFQALHEETEGDLVEGNVEGGIDARLGLASAKGEAARIGLQRARVYLNQGRRNVIWWKHFYTMAAQYHSERLLVGLVRLIRITSKRRDTDPNLPRQGNDPSAAEVYNRLRRGYSAIRLAYELQLPGENTIPLWLKRTWLETTAAGYCLGQLYLDELVRRNLGPNHIPTDQDRDANRKYVRETLEVLMGSQLKKWFVRDELKVAANNLLEYCDYWFDWNDKSKRENYRSADALQFRSELLEAIVKGIYPEDPTADNADGAGGFGLLSFKKWLDLK